MCNNYLIFEMKTALVVVAFAACALALPFPTFRDGKDGTGTNWAVLVAGASPARPHTPLTPSLPSVGSNNYYNYRHQS